MRLIERLLWAFLNSPLELCLVHAFVNFLDVYASWFVNSKGWVACKGLQGFNCASSQSWSVLMSWWLWNMYHKTQSIYSAGGGLQAWCMRIPTNATTCCTSQGVVVEMPACHAVVATCLVRKHMHSKWDNRRKRHAQIHLVIYMFWIIFCFVLQRSVAHLCDIKLLQKMQHKPQGESHEWAATVVNHKTTLDLPESCCVCKTCDTKSLVDQNWGV